MMSPKAKLLALLVAIDDYPSSVPALRGCVRDMERMADCLEKESSQFDVVIERLVNKDATKSALTDKFQTFLGTARKGDVVLFYFAGHGAQEYADPVFEAIDPDRKLEVLVCYDSLARDGHGPAPDFLADKELRYLIHKVSLNGPHIVTVFDCCHSGSNTRSARDSRSSGKLSERRLANFGGNPVFPVRKWQNFIFSGEVPYEKASVHPPAEFLPEGRHIHLAACDSDELACEDNEAGVFTTALVDVLERCERSISYYELQARIRNQLRVRYDQTPRIYSSGPDGDLYRGFLNKTPGSGGFYGNVSFNTELGWVVDLGAIHGMTRGYSGLKVGTEAGEELKADITEVRTSYSLISMITEMPLQPSGSAVFKAYVPSLLLKPLSFYIDGNDRHRGGTEEQIRSLPFGFCLAGTAAQADFCVSDRDDTRVIARSSEPYFPVVRPVPANDPGLFGSYLAHLARFEFFKELQNPNAWFFDSFPVRVSAYMTHSGQDEKEVPIEGDELALSYEPDGYVRFMLKNTSAMKLYVAFFYLSFYHGSNSFLEENTIALDPGREVWAWEKQFIPLEPPEREALHFNLKESVSYLKVVVSTTDFQQEIMRYVLQPLPGALDERQEKGVSRSDVDWLFSGVEDWATRLITLRSRNPEFNPGAP